MSHVFEDHGLADAVGADEDRVVAGLDEAEGEDLVERLAVDPLGPRPIEVCHRLERGDARVSQPAFETALLALALLDGEDLTQPRLVGNLVPAGEQAEQSEGLEARLNLDGIELGHGVPSFFKAS
jgi:hypothetical protein